jgi:hypothetical protein
MATLRQLKRYGNVGKKETKEHYTKGAVQGQDEQKPKRLRPDMKHIREIKG